LFYSDYFLFNSDLFLARFCKNIGNLDKKNWSGVHSLICEFSQSF
jgi:hypothetical protein